MASKPECLLLLITLLVLVVLQGSHGSRPGGNGQAQRLKELLRRKSRARQWMDDGETRRDSISAEFVIDGDDASDDGNKEDDLIEGGLPGQPHSGAVEFKQYGGYVTVHKAKGRSLFYYFAEASHDPSSKPLLLWLNGGPGCSSLGVGAFGELGPFGVNPDGESLYKRPYAWNRVANTLFIESPAGVGYSFSNTTADYNTTGDMRTAADTYTFLRRWLQRFPEYHGRDFYIAGESYAGHYVPELAYTIVEKNKKQHSSSNIIPLKGILVGNGVMNDVSDSMGVFDYMWSHSLISDETHRALTKHCINYSDPLCGTLDDAMSYEVGNIDFYSIYTPTCPSSSSSSTPSPLSSSTPSQKYQVRGYDPCESYYIYAYLNLPYVQAALHANVTGIPYAWDVCSGVISSGGWTDSPSSMFPIYRRLISSSLRIFIYSGDTDAVVPVTSTRYSLSDLKLKVKRPWKPWYDQTKQVGGYRVDYEGLTFATVRGAGHEVPVFQPIRALDLLRLFLEEK